MRRWRALPEPLRPPGTGPHRRRRLLACFSSTRSWPAPPRSSRWAAANDDVAGARYRDFGCHDLGLTNASDWMVAIMPRPIGTDSEQAPEGHRARLGRDIGTTVEGDHRRCGGPDGEPSGRWLIPRTYGSVAADLIEAGRVATQRLLLQASACSFSRIVPTSPSTWVS